MNPHYSPFRCDLPDVVSEQLSGLRDVSEGWYVEYKSRPIAVKAFGKSLSSFANQYGGWIIVGIAADAQTLKAAAFPGVRTADVPAALEALRNGAKDTVNPEVFYEVRVFDGPVDEIGLASDRSIIVARVPEGVNTPHVHLDGRIYRRVADSSDPRPESDRSLLDRLWNKGDRARRRLAQFVARKPTTSSIEENNPYLHLSLLSDPYGTRGHWYPGDFADFAALMKAVPLPFDNFFSQAGGFIARQVAGNNANLRLLTWEFSRDCSSFVTIPMNGYSNSIPLMEYRHGQEFSKEIEERELDGVRFLDLNILFGAVLAVATRHRVLAENAGVFGPFFVKAHLENVWRTVPFIDMPLFIAHVRECGIPVVQSTDILVPPGTDPVIFTILDNCTERPVPTNVWLTDAISVSIPIFQALGIPGELFIEGRTELLTIGERFNEVQAILSSRV